MGVCREELVCDGSWRSYILHLHHTPAVQVLYSVQVCINLFPPYLYLPWIPAHCSHLSKPGGWRVILSSSLRWRSYYYLQAMVGPACVATFWPWRWRCYQGEREGFEWQSPVRHPQHDQSEQGITNQSATKHLLLIWIIYHIIHYIYSNCSSGWASVSPFALLITQLFIFFFWIGV